MKQQTALTHEFVEFTPDDLNSGVIYVCVQYATVAHKCCCGCGKEVVTPLSPTDWKLIFDGKSITLDPSIGNWSLECQSHYWIRCNRVLWAPRWSQERIEAGRTRDRFAKERYYCPTDSPASEVVAKSKQAMETGEKPGIWRNFRNWWRGLYSP